MPWTDDAAVRSIRLAYNAALAAHSSCARALNEATMRGEIPTSELIEAEKRALKQLNEAREKLHAAMASAIAPHEPPT